jgi:alkylation response protein AidB-like acyl-CoA dehydrogenase
LELEFTAEQDELRDSVRSVLTKESPVSLARAAVEEGARPDALWATMVELGWPALTVAEEHGGLGLGFVEAGIVAEELGRVIGGGPWLPTVTQFAAAVEECGTPEQQARFLAGVAHGTVTGTVAVAEASGLFTPESVRATATPTDHGYLLAGAKRYVMAGGESDELVVVARRGGTEGDDGVVAVVVPGDDVRASPIDSIDQSRPIADVVLDGVEVGADRILGEPGAPTAAALRRAFEASTVALALELVGTSQAIFDITLEYVKHREQFGVPVGSFQAVKHKLADCYVALERARATAYFAALTIAEDDPRRAMAVSVAKAAAGDCQRLIAKEGIQLHGGIGFTWEHDMHLYVKRCKGTEPLFGNAPWHRQRIADLLGL